MIRRRPRRCWRFCNRRASIPFGCLLSDATPANPGIAGPEGTTAALYEPYMANVLDFLARAKAHGIYVLPTFGDGELPRNEYFRKRFGGEGNRIYLTSEGIAAKARVCVRISAVYPVAAAGTDGDDAGGADAKRAASRRQGLAVRRSERHGHDGQREGYDLADTKAAAGADG